MRRWTGAALRRLAIEVGGWTVLLLGIAAIPLPGPGLLITLLGMVILAQQYEWAERRVDHVKRSAVKAASDGVQTVPRIVASLLGCAWMVALGVVWGARLLGVPGWWPVRDSWWLPGGWWTGGVLIGSAVVALGLLVYSFVEFRGTPYDPEAARLRDEADLAPDVSDPDARTSSELPPASRHGVRRRPLSLIHRRCFRVVDGGCGGWGR